MGPFHFTIRTTCKPKDQLGPGRSVLDTVKARCSGSPPSKTNK